MSVEESLLAEGDARYRHLMSPGRIGTLEVRNRIVHAPMSLGLGAGDGTCGDRFIAYYAARAKGGAGLINIGTVSIGYPEGAVDAKQIAISDDAFLPSIRALADAVHAHGARIMLQLNHNGMLAGLDRTQGRPLAVPSIPRPKPSTLMDGYLPEELVELAALTSTGTAPLPDPGFRVLEEDGIRRIVGLFAKAARRAQLAGVDAVEIHAGHGYLLYSFLSPATNHRTDCYGGEVENRARFLVEVVEAVRAATGPDYPVLVKMDAIEFGHAEVPTSSDVAYVARAVRKAGADAITATGYADMSQPLYHSGAHTPQEERLLVPYAAALRDAAGGAVITAGRIEPEDADRDIAEGRYDFVAMGRKLLADPELPNRLAEGRAEAVRPCIYCYECISQAYFRRPVRCAVNPEMGHEHAGQPPASQGRFAVVGGGITGMETARRLAAAGASVTLIEQQPTLGGQADAAGTAYPPNARIADWLRREIAVSGIDVRTRASFADAPEGAIIIDAATPGHAAAPAGAITSHDPQALSPMQGHLVIIGAGIEGLSVALYHAVRGIQVSVLDRAQKAGRGVAIVRRWRLLDELRAADVTLRLGLSEISLDGTSVRIVDGQGASHSMMADRLILADVAADQLSAPSSSGALAAPPRSGPRTISDAIADAAWLAATALRGA